VHRHVKDSVLARALGLDLTGKISPVLYVAAILIAFFSPAISIALDALVALMWLVPDRRIETLVGEA
jgi:TMEM175 potassium channel family protein